MSLPCRPMAGLHTLDVAILVRIQAGQLERPPTVSVGGRCFFVPPGAPFPSGYHYVAGLAGGWTCGVMRRDSGRVPLFLSSCFR